jgi:hypothetical protein
VAPSAVITECEEAQITGISYHQPSGEFMYNDGAVAIGFPFVKIESEEAMEAIIVAIAGIAQVNSLIPENTYIDSRCSDRPSQVPHAQLQSWYWMDQTSSYLRTGPPVLTWEPDQ